MTGVGFNNSENRTFNRGFGRGYSKPYRKPQRPPSPQPTRKGDVFIEAGKLAVEYLVSHGLLSSSVLTGKWQNGTLKNNSRELKDHCNTQDKEISSSPIKERAVDVGNSKSQDDGDPSMDRNSVKVTSSQVLEPDNYNDPRETSKDPDTDVQISHSVESSDKNVKDEIKKDQIDVDSDLKTVSIPQVKDDSELEKRSDVVDIGHEETKDGTGKVDSEKATCMDELVIKPSEDKHDSLNNNGADLLMLCGLDKIPTKIRSSLATKRTKSDRDLINNEESTNETVVNGSSEIPSSVEIPSSYDVNQQKPSEPLSLTDKTFPFGGKSNEPKRDGSSDKERGEKRGLMGQNIWEGVKKAKQWLSVSQSSDYTQLSGVAEKRSSLPNRVLTENIFSGSNQESSYRICDLNLMGSSDIHENRDIPSLLYPSISASSKDAPVGIDLAINNSGGLNDMFNSSSGSARKGIEIIDLESDSQSIQDGKTTPPSMEVSITNMGNFPNNSQNPSNNSDSQNGYSFMISELLGNDGPNCSSAQPDMNSIQNDMGLHHGEVMFAEDDSIYMSLGEIPISLLRAWEPPNQERNPFGL